MMLFGLGWVETCFDRVIGGVGVNFFVIGVCVPC